MSSPGTSSPSDEELHLLYVLLDSNLPTGGFVSSSGLESYAKHGFLSPTSYSSSSSSSTSSSSKATSASAYNRSVGVSERIEEFARAEVRNYANTTLVFVRDAWISTDRALRLGQRSRVRSGPGPGSRNGLDEKGKGRARELSSTVQEDEGDHPFDIEGIVGRIRELDKYHDSALLSHVGRRSSRAQGVAMLTLYTKGLSVPQAQAQDGDEAEAEAGQRARCIVDGYKRSIRRNDSPGHLAVCWGVMTAVLGLTLDRAIHLHLFLHARSLLSSAVRLNLIGPYLSSQLLLHQFRNIIEDEVRRFHSHSHSHSRSQNEDNASTQQKYEDCEALGTGTDNDFIDPWTWADEIELDHGPSTTWPLGEILMARHDLQHSRIFNS